MTSNEGVVWLFISEEDAKRSEGFSALDRMGSKVETTNGEPVTVFKAQKSGWKIQEVYVSKNVEECRAVEKGTQQLLLEESQPEHACLNIQAGGGAPHMGKRDDSAMYGVYVLYNRGGIAPLVLNIPRLIKNIPKGVGIVTGSL